MGVGVGGGGFNQVRLMGRYGYEQSWRDSGTNVYVICNQLYHKKFVYM